MVYEHHCGLCFTIFPWNLILVVWSILLIAFFSLIFLCLILYRISDKICCFIGLDYGFKWLILLYKIIKVAIKQHCTTKNKTKLWSPLIFFFWRGQVSFENKNVDYLHLMMKFQIAMKELRARKIPFTIRRYLPDGRWDIEMTKLETLTRQLDILCRLTVFFFLFWNSYEDWGVDELIVEDSWKRQVGGG